MSHETEATPTREDADDSFVSINLESSGPCDICGLDTGEQVASACQLCLVSSARQPVQKGFNRMPDLLHAGVAAHESCLARSHQILTQVQRTYHHSPLPHRRGTSVPGDFSSLGLRDAVGDRLQWIVNQAKNEDVKNQWNRLQVHSNPCTRSSSPIVFRALTEDALLRRKSENNLTDASFLELRKSYARYLYGSSIPKSHSDDNVGCKTESCPSISVTSSNAEPKTKTTVPCESNVKGQMQSPSKTAKENALQDSVLSKQSKLQDSSNNNNDIQLSRESKLNSQPIPELGRERADGGKKNQRWSNKQRVDRDQLNNMSPAEIKKVVFKLEHIIKDISAELVKLLQERDSLGQEVKVRNLTIQKLVKMKHSQQEAPIKTAGVGNI
ncbi:uncharacterized protein LOC110983918 [Acanthaster planci]|uniref:Uncharacterized protein LOC110983918 n=1 Tax=Acanthaster planci TaxID=133434 RepID=A0A8B7Z7K1_ACAPL|nr:uncharacterized protein LOC110983918 [Acanthaster planci]